MRAIFLTVAVASALGAASARGQSLLQDASFFATVVGLNTVPDHGDTAVSYLDYRNFGYSIMVVDLASGAEQQVERVYYAEPVVSTFGARVTWIGYTPAGQPDVYVHDRSSGQTVQITSDAAFQNHPDLSAYALVWQDYRNVGLADKNADIYMHDFGSGTTFPVTTDPGYQDLPRIHRSRVVWQDYRHADSLLSTADIFVFDVATGQERRLTTGSFYRTHPALWEDLVVWEDYRNGDNGDIYLYDLSTSQEVQITTNAAHQGHPWVYGNWVLWLDYRNSTEQGDIYGYNLKTEQEYPLLIDPAHQERPRVYGDHAVWQDYRNGRFDLFAGNLAEPTSADIVEVGDRRRVRLSAAPNPFTHSVTFVLMDASQGPVELTIYDVLGRRVARRHFSSPDSAPSWDGRTDSGRLVPAGVYVATVSGRNFSEQIIFVRYV